MMCAVALSTRLAMMVYEYIRHREMEIIKETEMVTNEFDLEIEARSDSESPDPRSPLTTKRLDRPRVSSVSIAVDAIKKSVQKPQVMTV